jgi:hypothetical protein
LHFSSIRKLLHDDEDDDNDDIVMMAQDPKNIDKISWAKKLWQSPLQTYDFIEQEKNCNLPVNWGGCQGMKESGLQTDCSSGSEARVFGDRPRQEVFLH